MPEGYEGTILKKTERTSKLSTRAANEQDTEDDDDDDDVKMHVVDKVARFDHVTIWDHEAVPDQLEDSHVKGVAEWIKFAGAVCFKMLNMSLTDTNNARSMTSRTSEVDL